MGVVCTTVTGNGARTLGGAKKSEAKALAARGIGMCNIKFTAVQVAG